MGKKILSEAKTRENMLEIADSLGVKRDLLQIFAKYDKLLANCTNPIERKAISLAGNEEVHFFLNSRPGIIIVGDTKIGKE